MTEVFSARLDQQRTRLVRLRREVLRDPGSPEGVHDLRVTTRRLRTALDVFRPWVPRGCKFRSLRRGLRTLTRHLGAVRDLEVLDGILREAFPDLPDPRLASRLRRAERQARDRLLRVLGSDRTAGIEAALDRLSRELGARDSEPVGPWVPALVASSLAPVLAALDPMPESLERLHRVRICVKHLRYTLETFEPILTSGSRALLQECRDLQEVLGRLQDLQTCTESLERMIQGAGTTAGRVQPLLRWIEARREEIPAMAGHCRQRLGGFAGRRPWREALLEQWEAFP